MRNDNNVEAFFALVRIGIGHHVGYPIGKFEWDAIVLLSERQGLDAILVDSIERLPEDKRPPKPILLQWIGEVLQNYEQRYALYRRAIVDLAGWYSEHGFKMMVLKGYACSLDWPKPEHRPCGDIDIWLFGKQKEADAALKQEKGFKIDNSHHHHTLFEWCGFTIENHYDFVNVHTRKSNRKLDVLLKELGKDDTNYVTVDKFRIYLPSPNLNALFLIKHTISHFVSTSVNLRQLLDWAFFVEKHTDEINWDWLLGVLDEFHMKEIFNCINAICVEDLGFSSSIFHNVQFPPILKERILQDILFPAYSTDEPTGLIQRLIYKCKRWSSNQWKYKLCYQESMWRAFWSGVWNHLIKPSSI